MTTFRWEAGGLVPHDPLPEAAVRVAESWRQVDGHVRALDRHRARFAATLARCAPGLDANAVLDAAVAAVPGVGEWFPRVRLVVGDGGARPRPARDRIRGGDPAHVKAGCVALEEVVLVDVRPGPPRSPEVCVAVRPPGDPRQAPRVKGPDLAWAGREIEAARRDGAGEVLIRDEDGIVLEAGWASLVWWEGDDLCVPDPELAVLPSITRSLLEERARAQGIEVRPRRARLGDLDGREAWLLNAYQGLRPVTRWVGAGITPGAPVRAAAWRAWLETR